MTRIYRFRRRIVWRQAYDLMIVLGIALGMSMTIFGAILFAWSSWLI